MEVVVGRSVGGGGNRSGVASGGSGLSEFSYVETAEESEIFGGSSSQARLWVRDILAEVLVNLWERPKDFLGSGAFFCSSDLSLVEWFKGGLSLDGSEVDDKGGQRWLVVLCPYGNFLLGILLRSFQ